MMMRPSAILRKLISFKIPARLAASPAVAPLPVTTPFDQQLTAELRTLLRYSQDSSYLINSSGWLLHALEASTATHKIAMHSLSSVLGDDHYSDRIAIDEYLDNSVEMLDACNYLSEQIEVIRKYLDSLKLVSKALQPGRATSCSLARARRLLDSCEAIERTNNDSHSLIFYKQGLFKKLLSYTTRQQTNNNESDLKEILTASRVVASWVLVCGILQLSFCFKSSSSPHLLFPSATTQRSTSSSSWVGALNDLQKEMNEKSKKLPRHCFVMMELRETMMAARDFKNQLQKGNELKFRQVVEELKRRCGEAEEAVEGLERLVKELYSQLISVRMVLLGMLSLN